VNAGNPPWLLPLVVLLGGLLGRLLTAATLRLLGVLDEAGPSELRGEAAEARPMAAGELARAARRPGRGPAGWIPVAGWWLARGPRPVGWRSAAAVEALAIASAVAAWWWTAGLGMQLPEAVAALPEARAGIPARLVAHLVLFAFLAAAVWIDLRHRLIPDSVTVPGTLLGMLVVGLVPEVLLPVTCLEPRDHAAARAVADVLGALGPIGCGSPGWISRWPGLAVCLLAFTAWWSVGTAATPGRFDLRRLILSAGLAAVIVVWWFAGNEPSRRHAAVLASLAGSVISGGLVLLTREGASRALGREAMGMGDVTLMAMVGSWLGWQAGVAAFFIAAFLGLAHGGLGWLAHRDNELPYGPSLAAATVLVLCGWRPLAAWMEPWLARPLELLGVLLLMVALTAVSLALWSRLRARRPL